ncbi:MAG: hypothetical protein CTY33_03370 [Methylotenera sp.]|nr:MAG: hypothetical protein CTY33_03370 [Methylotenera sp.]
MKIKLLSLAVLSALATWAPTSMARQPGVALPYFFGDAPGDSVGQATGVDTTGAGLLTIRPGININTQNDVGGGITSNINNVASILFEGNSTVTGFTGTSLIRFLNITAGANATTVNFNGDVFTTSFNLSGTGTVNFNGSLNPGIVAASTNFDGDGFINVGANQVFTSAITTNTANTGTLTLNGGSIVDGAIGGANGLKQINVAGGNADIIGAVQTRQFSLGINRLDIDGALTTNFGGVINTTFASDATFGRIVLTGNSAIDAGGITVIPTVTGALTSGQVYRIVTAPSGTNAAPVSVVNNNPRYTFSGDPTILGNVDIRLVSVTPFAAIVNTPAAAALEGAPVEVQNALAILSNDPQAFINSLSQFNPGNTSLAAPWVAGQATRMLEDQVMARFDEVQNQCCNNSCSPSQYRNDPKLNTCDDQNQNRGWGKVMGSIGDQGDRGNVSGYDTTASGLALGYDVPIGDASRIGVAGGYTNTHIDDNNSGARTKVDSYQAMGYFEYAPQPWFVRTALTAGIDKYDSNRYISVPSFNLNEKISADYSGKHYSALVAVGKHFYANETTITPLVSLQATRINVDDFDEKGFGSLSVDNQNYNFLQSSVGVKAERTIKTSTGSISPEVHARWFHDFKSTTMEQSARFIGGDNTVINAQGIKQDRDLYNVGAGFTMLYCNCENNAWSVKGLYDYKWNDSDYSSHQFSLIANLNF